MHQSIQFSAKFAATLSPNFLPVFPKQLNAKNESNISYRYSNNTDTYILVAFRRVLMNLL
jgi:hypothetical protein